MFDGPGTVAAVLLVVILAFGFDLGIAALIRAYRVSDGGDDS